MKEPKTVLFADCEDGNHAECLVTWPSAERDGGRWRCSCPCHKPKSQDTATAEAQAGKGLASAGLFICHLS